MPSIRLPRLRTQSLAWIFIFLIFCVHLYAVSMRIEFWPLSHYPMFSQPLRIEDVRSYRIRAHEKSGNFRDLYLPVGKAEQIFYHRFMAAGDFSKLEKIILRDLKFQPGEFQVEVIEVGMDSDLRERHVRTIHEFKR